MSKPCGHKVPCGCGDKALTTSDCSPLENCGAANGKEPCSELFCTECISSCTEDISFDISGDTLSIPKGTRLDAFMQKMMIFLNNPTCADVAAIGLQAINITDTTVVARWTGDEALTYTVTWQEGLNVTTEDVVGVSTFLIQNLIPDTEYTLKLVAQASGCESVTLTFKTKA